MNFMLLQESKRFFESIYPHRTMVRVDELYAIARKQAFL